VQRVIPKIRSPALGLLAVFLGVFVAAFGFLYRQRITRGVEPTEPVSAAGEQTSPSASTTAAAIPTPTEATPVVTGDTASIATLPPEQPGPPAGNGDIPVRLLIRPGSDTDPPLAMLMNPDDQAVDVEVSAVNSKTRLRSVVQVSVLPHQRFNLDQAGLTVAAGDEVTLHDIGHRDVVMRVPP